MASRLRFPPRRYPYASLRDDSRLRGRYVPDAIAGIRRSAWRRIAQQAADIREADDQRQTRRVDDAQHGQTHDGQQADEIDIQRAARDEQPGRPRRTTTRSRSTAAPLNPIAAKIASKPNLNAKLTGMLPIDPMTGRTMTLDKASLGFKNQGQFIAALHVSQNLGIPFTELKSHMVTVTPGAPGQAADGDADRKPRPGDPGLEENGRRDDRSREGGETGVGRSPNQEFDNELDDLGIDAAEEQDHEEDHDGARSPVMCDIRRLWLVTASVIAALAVALPAAAQGNSGSAPGKNKNKKSTPPSSSSLPTGTGASSASPLSWIDDASLLAPGSVALTVSVMRWSGADLSEVDVPIIDAAFGLTKRVQLSASVPHVVGSADGTGAVGGLGTSYFSGKIALLDNSDVKRRRVAAPRGSRRRRRSIAAGRRKPLPDRAAGQHRGHSGCGADVCRHGSFHARRLVRWRRRRVPAEPQIGRVDVVHAGHGRRPMSKACIAIAPRLQAACLTSSNHKSPCTDRWVTRLRRLTTTALA